MCNAARFLFLCSGAAAAAAAALEQLQRVSAGRLFEFDFAQTECASGNFTDSAALPPAPPTRLVGDLRRDAGAMAGAGPSGPCPATGALFLTSAAGTFAASGSAAALLPPAGARPAAYTVEVMARGHTAVAFSDAELLALGAGAGGGSAAGLTLAREGADLWVNKVRVRDVFCPPASGTGPHTCAAGWDGVVTHLVLRVGVCTAAAAAAPGHCTRAARLAARWSFVDGSGAAARNATYAFAIDEGAWSVAAPAAAPALVLGRYGAEKGRYGPMRGVLLLVAMYDRELAQGELEQNMLAGAPDAAPWRVAEDAGDVLPLTCAAPAPAPAALTTVGLPANPFFGAADPARPVRVEIVSFEGGGATLQDAVARAPAAVAVAAVPSDGPPLVLQRGGAAAGPGSYPFAVRFSPPADASGDAVRASVSYRAVSVADGTLLCAVTRRVLVWPVNDAPRGGLASARVTAGVPARLELATGASDVEGDAIVRAELTPSPANPARVAPNGTTLSTSGTELTFTFDAAQQAASPTNGQDVVAVVVVGYRLRDSRGAAGETRNLTVEVLNSVRALPAAKAVPEYVPEQSATAHGHAPAAYAVRLQGTDARAATAAGAQPLQFEIDARALPTAGTLFVGEAELATGEVRYDPGSPLALAPADAADASGAAWRRVGGGRPIAPTAAAAANANASASLTPTLNELLLVFVPAAYDFSTPTLTAPVGAFSAGARDFFLAPGPIAPPARSCMRGLYGTGGCSVRFRVATARGALSKPAAVQLDVVNAPSTPGLRLEQVPAADRPAALSVSASGAPLRAVAALEAVALRPWLDAGGWIDRDRDAYEWRAELRVASGSLRFANHSLLLPLDFQRRAAVGDGAKEARRLVFFGRPSAVWAALQSLEYFATAEGDDELHATLSNTACLADAGDASGAGSGGGAVPCTSAGVVLGLRAARSATELKLARGYAVERNSVPLVIPQTTALGTSVIFLFVGVGIAFSCCGYWRHKLKSWRRRAARRGLSQNRGCGCCHLCAPGLKEYGEFLDAGDGGGGGAGSGSYGGADSSGEGSGLNERVSKLRGTASSSGSARYGRAVGDSVGSIEVDLDPTRAVSARGGEAGAGAGAVGDGDVWEAFETNEGRQFYYNERTGVSSWTRPVSGRVVGESARGDGGDARSPQPEREQPNPVRLHGTDPQGGGTHNRQVSTHPSTEEGRSSARAQL
eukprot:g889.t1